MKKKYSKVLVTLITLLMVVLITSCNSNRKHDFLDFDLGMNERNVTQVAEAHNGIISDGPWNNTLRCEFSEGYQGFPIDDFSITAFLSEDKNVNMMVTTILFIYDKNEDKEKEYNMVLEYLDEQYGKHSLYDDKYVWEDIKAKNGNKMIVSLSRSTHPARDAVTKDMAISRSLLLDNMVYTTISINHTIVN